MNSLAKLAKEGKIGQLCQRGAWIVAALGTLEMVLQLYALWQMYQQLQLQSQPGLSISYVYYLLNNGTVIFGSAINTIFYFLVLYVAGTILNTIFHKEDSGMTEDGDITIEPLKKEEVVLRRNDHA